jgi:hypothetical protein
LFSIYSLYLQCRAVLARLAAVVCITRQTSSVFSIKRSSAARFDSVRHPHTRLSHLSAIFQTSPPPAVTPTQSSPLPPSTRSRSAGFWLVPRGRHGDGSGSTGMQACTEMKGGCQSMCIVTAYRHLGLTDSRRARAWVFLTARN